MKRWEKRGKWFVLGGAFGEAIERLESKGVRGKGIASWSQGLEATSASSWAPMWDHYGRKD